MRSERAATATLVLALFVALYAVLRVGQALAGGEPEPTLVQWSTRIAYFWRLAVAGYGALLGMPVLHRWVVADCERAVRAAGWAVPASWGLLVVQAAVWP